MISTYFSFLEHRLTHPVLFHRQFEQDFPSKGDIVSICKLVFAALSMVKGMEKGIMVSSGALRVAACSYQAYQANAVAPKAQEVVKGVFSAFAVALAFKYKKLALLGLVCSDLVGNVSLAYQNRNASGKIKQELLRALGSASYIAAMFFDSIGIRILTMAILTGEHYAQGNRSYREGKKVEAISSFILQAISLYHGCYQGYLWFKQGSLVRKSPFFSSSLVNERNIAHLYSSPLLNYTVQNKGHRALYQVGDKTFYFFGQNHFGYGGEIVKGMNLRFFRRGGKALDFKLNHVFRDNLQLHIEDLLALSPQETQELLSIRGSDIKDIVISEIHQDFATHGFLGPAYEIHLVGLGKIFVGASKDLPNCYDRITTILDKGNDIYDFHKALSVLGLEKALERSSSLDLERMKLGHLFRIFSPQKATLLERSESFFSLSIEELKQEMCNLNPDMEGIFEKYLPRVELREVFPGRKRFAIKGLADELRQHGAVELIAAIAGDFNDDELCGITGAILNSGMCSTETRTYVGLVGKGISESHDLQTGGSDSVFTQLVTTSTESYDTLFYSGDGVSFLISLDALETGTYQYHFDSYGVRNLVEGSTWLGPERYLTRPDILSFVKDEAIKSHKGNEIMIKEFLSAEYITGIIVRDEILKQKMIDHLRSQGLVRLGFDGQEWIGKHLLKKFIRVQSNTYPESFNMAHLAEL